jgi:7,8-dihydropterin-6-yl-methyl-4-(beta-D-ribofuranosyl)aminobenzene 5'-phosphate synthase
VIRHSGIALAVVLTLCLASVAGAVGDPPAAAGRVTILYDAFGDRPGLERDWGFSALIEYGGRRILFDAGNDGQVFARNLRRLGVDLRRLDFAVISHRHGDHTGGLAHLLRVNPAVTIYVPSERFGVFGGEVPITIVRPDTALPTRMRYFGGMVPAELSSSSAWPGARFVHVDSLTEIAPGVALVSTVSRTPGTLELRELSLVLRTSKGLVVFVGCSHPGIETILEATRAYGDHVHEIFGGLHLVSTPDTAIARIATDLRDVWRVDLIAPGHCTGEPAFDALARTFGARYVYAGLGSVVPLL